MITIITILLIIASAYLHRRVDRKMGPAGFKWIISLLFILGFSFLLFFEVGFLVTKPYRIMELKTQREVLSKTLELSDKDNKIASSGLYVEVANFNKSLLIEQKMNNVFLFDEFIGDEIDNITPIEIK